MLWTRLSFRLSLHIEFSCVFSEERIESGHTTIKPRSVESPHMIMELNQSHHLLLGHYYNQSPSPLISQFGQEASSRKSPGCSKLLPLRIIKATSVCEPSMQQKKILNSSQILFLKEVSYAHKGCIYLIKNTIKTVIL